MNDPLRRYHLHICLSTDQKVFQLVDLTETVTHLGRPEAYQRGPGFIDLQLDGRPELDVISRNHAKVVHQDDRHILTFWEGRLPIGLFELQLTKGQSHQLRPNYTFRIPDVEGPHVRITFNEHRGTGILPLLIKQQRQEVLIFGQQVAFQLTEYKLLAYLHQHEGMVCRWDDIIEVLWPGDSIGDFRSTRKDDLNRVLAETRRKIRTATNNEFSFLETFRGEGVRLVL